MRTRRAKPFPTRAWTALVLIALAVGCDDEREPRDGGMDAGLDAGRDAASPDAQTCSLECSATDTCCVQPDGTPICAMLRSDPRNCGVCGNDCIGQHRGDRCMASACQCGSDRLGCVGNRQSYCCPARTEGGQPYCADIDRGFSDCGACNSLCDPAQSSRCDGGRCVCGTSGGPCAGTAESLCCADSPADVRCIDTRTDSIHCGRCNNSCMGAEQCRNGSCTFGDTCDEPCPRGTICCNGTCCTRQMCGAGACG